MIEVKLYSKSELKELLNNNNNLVFFDIVLGISNKITSSNVDNIENNKDTCRYMYLWEMEEVFTEYKR